MDPSELERKVSGLKKQLENPYKNTSSQSLGKPTNEKRREERRVMQEAKATQQSQEIENEKSSDSKFEINLPKSMGKFFFKAEKLEVDNLYLLHHKYSLQFYHERNSKLLKPESFLKAAKQPSLSEIKDPVMKEKLPRPKPCEINEKSTSSFQLAKRTTDLAKACDIGENPAYHQFKLLDKLIIGMGGESPYDSLLLMTLHPLYGVPYLPATAIKGMLRSYFEQIEGLEGVTHRLNKDERNRLFGSEDDKKPSQSQLIFFDTFPKGSKFEISFDVMTPHYKDYYNSNGQMAPTDDQDTNIITFPVVTGACFDVYVACRDAKIWSECREKIEDGLKEAFSFCGIGAKTALGYGLGK